MLLIELANDGLAIDIFVISHGWKTGFGGNTKVDEAWITNANITNRLAPAETGLSCVPTRTVSVHRLCRVHAQCALDRGGCQGRQRLSGGELLAQ